MRNKEATDLFRFYLSKWPLVEVEPVWIEEDRIALAKFLKSKAGKKLLMLLKYTSQEYAGNAIHADRRLEFFCGYAAGCRGLTSLVASLGQLQPPQELEQHEPVPPTPAELLEQLGHN